MAANYDPEHLIILIEERPILYNKCLPEYSDKNKKEEQWEIVTQIISGDSWTIATSLEKRKMCKDIQLKWKHLRDNFRKELQAQKTSTSGQGAKKKKKYRYFDQLLFLTPYVSDAKTSGNYASPLHDSELLDNDENVHSPVSVTSPVAAYSSNSNMSTSTPRRNTNIKQKAFEDEVLHVMKSRQNAEDDEDRAFCMSLVKSLKKMSDETKLNAKIDILHVIRNYTHTQSNYTQIPQNTQQIQTANIQPFAPYNFTNIPQNSQQIQTHYQNFQQPFTPHNETISKTFMRQQTPYTKQNTQTIQTSYTDPNKKITILDYQTIPSGSTPQSTQSFFSNFAPNSPCNSTDTNE